LTDAGARRIIRVVGRLRTTSTAILVATFAAAGTAGPASAAALRPADRAVVRIASLKVTVLPEAAVVRVRLGAGADRRLGAGRLRTAGVGVVLAHRGAPALVAATVGPGPRSRLVEKPRTAFAGIARIGRDVTFYLADPDADTITKVAAMTFTSKGVKLLGRASAVPGIDNPGPLLEDAFRSADSASDPSLAALVGALASPYKADRIRSCDELRRELARVKDTIEQLRRAIASLEATRRKQGKLSERDSEDLSRMKHRTLPALLKWQAHAAALLPEFCAPGTAGGEPTPGPTPTPTPTPTPAPTPAASPTPTPTPTPSNQTPTADFTVSPNSPPTSPKAGATVAFDGTKSSDPDGTISSHHWEFQTAVPPAEGDPSPGSPSQATADGPSASVTFSGPGRYPVKLTVTDDRGGTATRNEIVFVSGPGQKADTLSFLTAQDPLGCSGTIMVSMDIYVPSYAQFPTNPIPVTFLKTGGCAGANVQVTNVVRTGASAPPDRIDEWGQVKDTVHIEFTITGGTASDGAVQGTVAWQ